MTSVWHDGQLVVADLHQITPEEREALQALVGAKVAAAVKYFWTEPIPESTPEKESDNAESSTGLRARSLPLSDG